jgi:hypothetical protein
VKILYLHFPMCLCGIVLHYLSTGTILPYLYFSISTVPSTTKFTVSLVMSDTLVIAVFVIPDLCKAFHDELGGMFMIYSHIIFHIPRSSCSLVFLVEPNVRRRFM